MSVWFLWREPIGEHVWPLLEEWWGFAGHPGRVVGDGGLEAWGWLCVLSGPIFILAFLQRLSAQNLLPALSQFCPHVNQGFSSFSKQAFRSGSYRPRFSDRRLERHRAGKTGGPREIGGPMEANVIRRGPHWAPLWWAREEKSDKSRDVGNFSGTSQNRGRSFLSQGQGGKFRFQGWYIWGGTPQVHILKHTCLRPPPKIRDWVPLRKLKEKKYIIIY